MTTLSHITSNIHLHPGEFLAGVLISTLCLAIGFYLDRSCK